MQTPNRRDHFRYYYFQKWPSTTFRGYPVFWNPCNQEALALKALNPPDKKHCWLFPRQQARPLQAAWGEPTAPSTWLRFGERAAVFQMLKIRARFQKAPGGHSRDKKEKTKLRLSKLDAGTAGMPPARVAVCLSGSCSSVSRVHCPENLWS